KEVHEAPPPLDPNADPDATQAAPVSRPPIEAATVVAQPQGTPAQAVAHPTAPYQPGPELTPGTTAALMAAAGPQKYEPPRPKAKAGHSGTPSPQDMQSLGEGVGDALRTFRQAVSDVRGAIDPEVRTIQAEIDAAQKEIEQTVESAKQMPAVEEEPPKKTGA